MAHLASGCKTQGLEFSDLQNPKDPGTQILAFSGTRNHSDYGTKGNLKPDYLRVWTLRETFQRDAHSLSMEM